MRLSRWLTFAVAVAATGCGTNPPPPPPPPTFAPAVPLAPDQRVENPAYTRWATATPGTVVTYQSSTDVGGAVTRGQYVQRLVSRNEAAAEVESQEVNPDSGKPVGEPQTLKQLRWMGKSSKGDADPARPPGTYATGSELVTLNGKEYKTQWYKFKGHVEAGETDTQTWYAADVPGGLVKSVHTIPAIKKTVTAELAQVKTP